MFCAKCGATGVQLFNNLCENCYNEIYPLARIKRSEIQLNMCRVCGAIELNHRWVKMKYGFHEILGKIILKNINKYLSLPKDANVQLCLETFSSKDVTKNIFYIPINIEAPSSLNSPFRRDKVFLKLKVNQKLCQSCSNFITEKFKSILQIRFKSKNVEKHTVENKIRTIIEKYENSRPGKLTVKELRYKNGLDLYFSNVEIAKHLAKQLEKTFKCRTTISGRTIGWNKLKSKKKLILTILLEII